MCCRAHGRARQQLLWPGGVRHGCMQARLLCSCPWLAATTASCLQWNRKQRTGAELGQIILVGRVVAMPGNDVEGREGLSGCAAGMVGNRTGQQSGQAQQSVRADHVTSSRLGGHQPASSVHSFKSLSTHAQPGSAAREGYKKPPTREELPLQLVDDCVGTSTVLKPGRGRQEVARVGQPVGPCAGTAGDWSSELVYSHTDRQQPPFWPRMRIITGITGRREATSCPVVRVALA